MPVAKKTTAKGKTAATKSPATKAKTSRPSSKNSESATTPKRGRAKAAPVVEETPKRRGRPAKTAAPAAKGKGKATAAADKPKRKGPVREFDETTGFVPGTDQHYIAQALLNGAESRQAVIDQMRKELDSETRNGTPKPVANVVAGVIGKMVGRGFTVESSFRLVPPTPASKRAATKRANAKK